MTFGTPTWIWSVVGAQHVVRAYTGTSSRWSRATLGQPAQTGHGLPACLRRCSTEDGLGGPSGAGQHVPVGLEGK
ncbi:DUF2255 family protein (plasmid) [Deinococcus sp. KNUC1210]|nr:DUF2255 family protein [Deinococcus sp. KNUC1210]